MADVKFLKRSFWQRVLGKPATGEPVDKGCYTYANGELKVDLARAPELSRPGGALRFEGDGLPVRVLVVHAEKGDFHAFLNRCTHLGHRRLDYVPGTDTVQCCSVNKSTYTFAGQKIHGPAPKPATPFEVEQDGDVLTVRVRT